MKYSRIDQNPIFSDNKIAIKIRYNEFYQTVNHD